MSFDENPRPLLASLGTSFAHDRVRDMIRITAPDGTEVEVPGPDLREFVRQLMDGVPSEGPTIDDVAVRYSDAIDRVQRSMESVESRLRTERGSAAGALAELLNMQPEERSRAVEADERLRTLGLAARALEESRRVVGENLARSLELAELGRCMAQRLNPQVYGARHLRDFQAYAEAVYGNGLRINQRMPEARAAFQGARELLELGTGDPHTVLEIDGLEISLRRRLRDFPRALELSERLVKGNLELGQIHAAAQALQQRAIVLDVMGETEQAAEALEDAVHLSKDSDDPMLIFTVHQSLAICLVRLGRPREAEALLPAIDSAGRRLESPRIDATQLWLHGLIEHESGDPVRAVESLERARSLFADHDFPFDLAQVSLDLAAALASLGRVSQVAELAAATYAYMETHGVQRDALTALAVLRQAALREELSRDLLRTLGQKLERAFSQPPLPAS